MGEVCVFSYSKILASFAEIHAVREALRGTVRGHYKGGLALHSQKCGGPGVTWAFVEGVVTPAKLT